MKPIHILLVEDNEGDILLTMDALEEGRISNKVSVIKDGNEAIDFLMQSGKYAAEDLPDLILLDVNLPKRNGHEVLSFIKNTESLKQIPVIMLTTSSSEIDIEKAYKGYANCYITKPFEVNDFITTVMKIADFWLSIVSLPPNSK
ncbi:response regulator receiver protein (plasmid) [Emticicia oligotrophica DSM 17448]|uniref:Response regulator receiver protein n=1 Tax=Emticicia oligotrophica (strain DSM 17448 / CIP 109782 / MTCC 6937 / GPTSA100-15) TaxID=929562 RepID=A0ABM5N8A5_EMTOG|nr:response regulator [Emticicia oligotrophica]AFK05713.1 response regulator receiver protein [Emticicia oligotrophica DSM 17448]